MTKPPRPGYWLANDGKWYPPELHPDRVRAILEAERLEAAQPSQPDAAIDEPGTGETEPDDEPDDEAEPVQEEAPAAGYQPVKTETASTQEQPVDSQPATIDASAGPPPSDPPEATSPEFTEATDAATEPSDARDLSTSDPDKSRWNRSDATPADESITTRLATASPIADSTHDGATPVASEPETRGLLAKRQSVVAPPQAPYEPPTTAEPVEASTNAAEFTQPSSGVPTKADGLTETAALADPRSEIPEPFPETVESNLLDPEERPSFLKRWWKAIAIMLAVIVAANALVWWVQRDDSGSQSSNGPDVFELDEGTCIDEPTLAEQAEVKGSVKTVSCLELHTHEVFHTVKHPAGDFDTVLIQRFAEAECVSRFETYTGTLYDRSVLNFVLLLPNEKAWEDADRRSTICALYDDSGPTTGSAKLAP